ncbi:MAG: cytochrome b N-terminal domain-containing protein [Acidobacteriota bacterium]|nr:cytochrome b N-terminal domain-containing protein [Acidobacteriota bacterium]
MEKKENVASAPPAGGSLPKRVFHWLDRRAGLDKLMKESLDEPIPGGARFAYVFGSGLLFIFISQIITGICLALYYVPSAETAHTSVAYITKKVAAGDFLRSLHYYGSSAMVIVLLLHFLQTFLYGSFKGRRELLWISGATLSLLVLGMGFTGYLLPWDQRAYFATAVGTNIVGEIPLIGEWLTRLLRGGDTIGTLTLSRFYVAHVFLIPGVIFAFIGIHIFLFRKAGAAGPINEDPVKPKLPPEGFYPRQVLMDMAFAMLLMVGLGFLAHFHPVGLGPIANPADTHFLPRPEWYYLPMFEWLKFWEGPKVVFAVVVTPALLAALFFLLPFLDRSLERRPWRRPIPLLAVAFVLLGTIFLGVRSQVDDRDDPTTAAQLALQAKQERAYSAAPFEPYMESPGGTGPLELPIGPVSPLVSQGRGIFQAHGCSGCHGDVGLGTTIAPSLKGITTKFPQPQLIALLHNPNAAMRAGHMPAVDISGGNMSALLAYLGVIGTSAANVQATSGAVPQPPATGQGAAPAATAGAGSGAQPPVAAPAQLSAAAATGQQIFQQRSCFACHGQSGIGGVAPAIAPLIAQISDAQLAQLLEHPNAKMKAGGMPPVSGTPDQRNSLIAYLRTLGPAQQQPQQRTVAQVAPEGGSVRYPDMAPTPARPAVTTVASVSPPALPGRAASQGAPVPTAAPSPSPGRALFLSQGCSACHGPTAQGTRFAPSLIGIAKKFPGGRLPALLRHPTSKMRDGGMPTVTLSDAQLGQLVAYLSTLEPAAATPPSAQANLGAQAPNRQPAPAPPAVAQAPPPAAAVPAPLSPLALQGHQIFQRMSCETCHGVGGLHGTVAAPPLAGTASLLPANVLENLLRHHTIRMQQGGMPLTNLNPQDMKALVAYIRSMPASSDAK